MRWLKFGSYLLLAAVLQAVVFPRINFFGFSPDLILVSVICIAVLGKEEPAMVFAGIGGFLQDIISYGIYINMATRVLACALVNILRESFVGNEYSLAAGFVGALTPLILIIEAVLYLFFGSRELSIPRLVLTIIICTGYNLLMVPLIFPIIKALNHD